jgi:hypothetical protein
MTSRRADRTVLLIGILRDGIEVLVDARLTRLAHLAVAQAERAAVEDMMNIGETSARAMLTLIKMGSGVTNR